tara:strand:+ start:126 stop:497 length:372 start_codon:yes stop_codon:yes gene_type:complete
MSDIVGRAGSKSKIIGVDGQSIKAWCVHLLTAIRQSFNISSVTDVGTGQFKYNMINVQSTADFVCGGNNCDIVDTGNQIYQIYKFANQTTSSWLINSRTMDNNAPSMAVADPATESYSFIIGN